MLRDPLRLELGARVGHRGRATAGVAAVRVAKDERGVLGAGDEAGRRDERV
jgi:hypothetical protein